MKFMGIWPEERKVNNASSYKVLFPIGFMILFITIPQTTNLYFIWGDFELIVENLSVANMTITIAVLKTATFWSNGRSMKVLLTHMENDRKEANTEENITKMTRIADVSRTITAGSIIMCNFLVILYVTLRIVLLPYTGRSLFYSAYFPYDTRHFPNFELTQIGQVTAAFYAANSYTAVDTFMMMLVLHVCGQFSSLRKQLSNLCCVDKNHFQIDLIKIVEKYDMLNSYAETIEDRFNNMLLMQMIGCTVQLCVQSYQAISALVDDDQGLLIVRLFFFAVYTTYVMLHIYLYCYVGQKLFTEGTEMAYAAYNCNWYNLSPNDARCLTIIMSRAQISSRITAGKFCSFNHVLFSNILKTSMGYLSVLYAMKTKDMDFLTNYITQAISVLLSNMEKDRKETNAKDEVRRMMRIANICRKISIGCTLTYYMVIILFIILHLLFIRYIGRVLIIRSYFPYNIQSTPNYELTIFAQILAAWCTGGVYTSVDTFVATLVFHLCGQLNNLKHNLRDLYSHDGNEIKLKIAKIVKKHNSLNRFTETIEQKFNVMLLLQMLGCSLQLCVTSFQILMALERKNGVILAQTTFLSAYLIYILLQIYLYCYIGEKLISESIGIFDAAYECKWYTLPPSEVKSLMIIMIRAKVPLRITAGKFCSFKYQLFCNILRTSMSYLSLLHAMNIVNTE
ncbi:PREDICTED: odorant receptor 13a-like [Polistes canadensis]|uniref:odorant receptor 13a-like n=1 Tax=Polistes canadensis TaxID=91411 RepID=UPI000718BCC9|nr:PREDICTED: odorant receptor 13a-like [Polistes canadensis]